MSYFAVFTKIFVGSYFGKGIAIRRNVKRLPERWSTWATVGRVLVESFQDIEIGCSVSVKGIQLQPQLADAWFRHGRVLALALKHQEAIALR